MQTRSDQAREVAITLAARGRPDGAIIAALRKEGLDGVLSHSEIERLVTEAAVARKMKSGSGAHRLFRVFGIFVVVAGVLAILISGNRWAIWAIVLGLTLALHPESASDDAGVPWR